MDFSFKIVFLMMSSVSNGIGILASAFIVSVNLLDWVKDRGIYTYDVILVTMAITSICYQCAYVRLIYAKAIWSDVHGMDYFIIFLHSFTIFTGSATCWCATCLCVFYCVKIVDFKVPLFFCLKMRICKAVPWLLTGSVLGPLAISIDSCWKSCGSLIQRHANLTGKSTTMDAQLKLFDYEHIPSLLLGFCMPILFDIVSITLLISLCRHARRMKENSSGFSQPRLEVHFAAAKMVGVFLFIDLVFLLNECIIFVLPDLWWKDILEILMSTFEPAQTVNLILGNSKLKQALWKVFSTCRK